MGIRRLLGAVALLGLLAVACSSGDDGGNAAEDTAPDESTTTTVGAPVADTRGDGVAAPTQVDGPIEGGRYDVPYSPMPDGLADQFGYTEEEWFISGEATSYAARGPLAGDGAWTVRPDATAPYTTRILVRHPEDPADFNGTVLVEWLNVSAGRDSDPDFGFLNPLLLAEGYAYVGVSAQATGVQGGGAVLEVPGVPEVALLPLKEWDPQRYEPLTHPGDEFSYDIYSQVASLVRRPGDVDPLAGLDVQHVIAAGESQSAGRMVTYVDAIQPVTDIYDGFLIHSRGDSASALNADPALAMPEPTAIRSDLDVPVLQFETETDLLGLGYLAARQDDTDQLVTWETAGTAHADQSTLDYGALSGQRWLEGAEVDFTEECGTINNGPQAPVLRAAFSALAAWVIDGTPPPPSPRIEIEGGDIARDDLGNALGGIRTPPVDAPVDSLTGNTPAESVFCSLFGASTPLTAAQLADRYADHDQYVAEVTESADAAVDAGFLLPEDRDTFVADATSADVP